MKTQIFVVNLEKRLEKKERMIERLKGLDYKFIKGIDGSSLSHDDLEEMKVGIVQEWKDPCYKYKRGITWGQIGCALSHYSIYEECEKNKIDIAIILQDDVLIPEDFSNKLKNILENLKQIDWNLCYLGRNRRHSGLRNNDETESKEEVINEHFVKAKFSYWLCGYIMNSKGMKKILNAKMKENLIPHDEFIPIMGGVSPHKNFYKYYNIPQPLKLVSIKNLIIEPETNAFRTNSDTENSQQYIFNKLDDTRININPERLLKKFNLLVFIEIEGFSTPNMIETIEDNINNTECLVNYYYSKNNTNKVTLDKATEVKGSTEAVRNKILDIAYSQDVDFLWYLNSKNIITNKNILGNLILRNKSIIGPMLTKKHKLWSNFWRNIDENGWYKRAPDYLDIVNRSLTGCWNVMHLYGNYLINKETISKIKNFYSGNFNKYFSNDMIFSKNCRDHNIPMYIDNTEYNGYIYDLKDTIPSNVVHREFYTFETDREAWTKKYLHPEFYKAISNWNKLDYTEPCHYVYHFPFVSDTFCKHLLDEVNNVNLWSKGINQDSKLDKRIGAVENIPTIDIHMKQIGFKKQWESIVKTYIGPLVSHLYSPYKTKGLNIAFVVKYELGKQEFLRPHHDSSTYSITITLNRPGIDFEGGGTRFVKQETLVVGKKGFATIQPGKLTHYHEGTPITKGIRFIMVSFVN